MNVSYGRKMAGAWDRCRAANIAFFPIVAESLGGWHPVAVDQIKKLARCLAMHTGQAIEASTAHLFTRLSTVLVRGCVEMVLNSREECSGSFSKSLVVQPVLRRRHSADSGTVFGITLALTTF